MNSGVVSTGNRSQIAIATGFLGAFIVGSLAVQMVRSQGGVAIDGTRPNAQVEPVIASPATLWADMDPAASWLSNVHHHRPSTHRQKS